MRASTRALDAETDRRGDYGIPLSTTSSEGSATTPPSPMTAAAGAGRGNRLAVALSIAGVVLALAYPFAVYWGFTRFGARELGLILLALNVPLVVLRLRRLDRGARRSVLLAPALIAVLACVTALFDDVRAVLALPVLINLALLFTFGRSLRDSRSIVEHFARLLVTDLSEAERQYCRSVTRVWCLFFASNAAIAAVLALAGPMTWWVAYTGLIAYLLMGLLFTVEIIVRFLRFRRTGLPWLDRLFARIFRRASQ